MRYFLGIDGGGTKTAYLLTDENGNCAAQARTAGCSYKEIGIQGTVKLLRHGVLECLAKAGIEESSLTAIVAGIPCYGELKEEDVLVEQAVKREFTACPVLLTNDVEAGWAGSLGIQPGVNVVAGTGSIAFGKNKEGQSARSGGWSTFFGDEGSCYWLGRRTMELFSKQADGRTPKGPLYEIVMKEFGLKDDMDFIELMEREYISDRSKVASVQRLLLKAASQGDDTAVLLYQEAGKELGLMAESILKKLWKGEEIPVSYSGGLFHAKEFVLPVFEEYVKKHQGILVSPLLQPVHGAALMAIKTVSDIELTKITEKWIKETRE